MRARTTGARIAGVVSCVPPRIVDNTEFEQRFGAGAAEVTKMTGVKQRHYAEDGVATSDMCEKAAEHLLAGLGWERDSVDGVIFVSQSPDLLLPATACIVQGRMGLRPGIIGYDVSLGCSGYPYGLWQAMMTVMTGAAKRMLVMVGDISTAASTRTTAPPPCCSATAAPSPRSRRAARARTRPSSCWAATAPAPST
jgi:3-oxoacyl-[acyl-carrier-protein] synthase-3